MLGLAVAFGSALLAAVAVQLASFWLLMLATVVAGFYSANGQLYRFAAGELAAALPKHRLHPPHEVRLQRLGIIDAEIGHQPDCQRRGFPSLTDLRFSAAC